MCFRLFIISGFVIAGCMNENNLIGNIENMSCEKAIGVLDSLAFNNSDFFVDDNFMRYKYANCLGEYERYEEGVHQMLVYLEAQPRDLNAKMILGHFYSALGETEKAKAIFLEVHKIDSKYPNVNYNLAVTFIELKYFDYALKYIDRQIELVENPDFETQLLRCEILTKLKNWNDAASCYQAIPYSEFDFWGMKDYSLAMKALNKVEEAEQFLINLALHHPEQYEIFNELAFISLEIEKYERTEAYLEKSKSIESDTVVNPEMYLAYAALFGAKNQKDSCCLILNSLSFTEFSSFGIENLRKECCD